MSYLSIRNLPEHLERHIVKEARRLHKSKSAVVIDYLEAGVKAARRKNLQQERQAFIRDWAGHMKPKDAEAVLAASEASRTIDREMWQ